MVNMIDLSPNKRLITDIAELPQPGNIDLLFADFETTSLLDDEDSLNPWHHCYALGLAFTWDTHDLAYYVPLAHRDKLQQVPNLLFAPFAKWWLQVLQHTRRWANHNIKYDAHVSANSLGVVPPEQVELFDTVTHAKIIDSDRHYKGGYGLDALSKGWLQQDISEFENEIKRWLGPVNRRTKDYGVIPAKPMGDYACQDVLTNRSIYKYIEQLRPPECDQVAAMETELTRVLFELERNGLTVNPVELMTREAEVIGVMLQHDVELSQILGRTINPNSTDDVYDVLINQYGLPVMGWTEEDNDGNPAGNPSFDKHAMKRYLAHPYSPHRVVEIIAEYRKLSTHRSLFLEKYQKLHVKGKLHSSYNQAVRTGRMSCKEPNNQQLDEATKELVHPGEGKGFLSCDFAQLEFKVIVHYINDADCIKAYNENPDTDFHDWVAKMCGMDRQPAKTMNFMMGYGGGKKKAVRTMAADTKVVGGIVGQIDQMVAEGKINDSQRTAMFDKLCQEKAEKVYDNYHRALPTLKPTSRKAGKVCQDRGYVFNLHGRRRHLPTTHAHNAFNSLCQGEAADIQKERTVALWHALKETGIVMVANVHDETVLEGDIELIEDRRTQIAVAWILEHPIKPLRVPLRVSLGTSRKNWREACKEPKKGGTSQPIHYTANELAWLQSTPESELFQWIRDRRLALKGKCTDTYTPDDSATIPVLGSR